VQFRDAAIYINSSVDGQLDIVADTEIQIAATTIDINGAINASGEIIAASLDISGDIDVDGTSNLDILDVDGAANFAADVTLADGADLITASAGTSNLRT
jgi:cytoskeletal protein CcmA (bactofilin family)